MALSPCPALRACCLAMASHRGTLSTGQGTRSSSELCATSDKPSPTFSEPAFREASGHWFRYTGWHPVLEQGFPPGCTPWAVAGPPLSVTSCLLPGLGRRRRAAGVSAVRTQGGLSTNAVGVSGPPVHYELLCSLYFRELVFPSSATVSSQ